MPRSPAFPWWFWLCLAGVHFWYVTAPAAIAFLLLGWYGADWPGGLRFVVFGVAALLGLPFAAAAAAYGLQSIAAARCWRTLDRDEVLAGAALPAGSRVRFADRAHSVLISVDLPHVSEVLGMRLVGTLTHYDKWGDVGPVWSGTLAEDQLVNGIPCRAGYFTFDTFGTVFDAHGTVHKFGLAAAHAFFGLNFPRGTAIRRGNANQHWDFLLPADAGVDVPVLAATAPGGVTLSIANDGRLQSIDSGHGQTIVVRGLPLNSRNFHLQGDQVVSELAEPAFVAGEMRPAGTGVVIDLPTSEVGLSG